MATKNQCHNEEPYNNKHKILQINLDRKRLAHNLLEHFVRCQKIDLVIGQEPGSNLPGAAIVDKRRDCFIWLPNIKTVTKIHVGEGVIGVELEQTWYVSCYFSPNRSVAEFDTYLEELDRFLKMLQTRQIVVCGDFNAKSKACGAKTTDKKGDKLEECIWGNELICMNDGKSTFVNANGASLIDVTLVSPSLIPRIPDWRVLDDDSGSEHFYICFHVNRKVKHTLDVNTSNIRNVHIADKKPEQPNTLHKGWKVTEAGMEQLRKHLDQHKVPADGDALTLVEHIRNACDNCLRQKKWNGTHKQVYWWNAEISEKRTECHAKRRKLTRAKAKGDVDGTTMYAGLLKVARKELKTAIYKAKERSWERLQQELDDDIWGKAYQIVTKKFRQNPPLVEEEMKHQVKKLFPEVSPIIWRRKDTSQDQIHEITEHEVNNHVISLKNRKAPGPDMITAELLKATKTSYITTLSNIINRSIKEQVLPDVWKTSRLVLLEKPAKIPGSEKSYRPICILDSMAKVMERIINERLRNELEESNALHPNQFGFRKGRSTLDALKCIESIVKQISSHAYKNQECCAMITLDIKNAFNSAPWDRIIEALTKAKVSNYLINLIQNYLENRVIILPNGDTYRMTCGVPQGSVLGPTLWNIFYNQVLTAIDEKDITLVAYADDLAVIIKAKNPASLEESAKYALEQISGKLKYMGLTLAVHKTESTILRGWLKCKNVKFKLEDANIALQTSLKYMGIHIDRNWNFRTHAQKIKEKTQEMIKYLCRLTSNTNGPRASKKRLLACAVHSVVLYGAPIWKKVIERKNHAASLEGINRKLALMISAAYRSAPTEAVLVLAKIPPIKLRIEQRIKIYNEGQQVANEAKELELTKWEAKWNLYDGHAKKFIPDLKNWLEREWIESDHFIAQAVTGHGVFSSFLFRIKKLETPECWYCKEKVDDVEHTLFQCDKWQQERSDLNNKVGVKVSIENVGRILTKNKESWEAVKQYIHTVLKTKMKDERQMQKGE